MSDIISVEKLLLELENFRRNHCENIIERKGYERALDDVYRFVMNKNIENNDLNKILCVNIRKIDCSKRLMNILKVHDIEILRDLFETKKQVVKLWRNCGAGTFKEIEQIMKDYSLYEFWI